MAEKTEDETETGTTTATATAADPEKRTAARTEERPEEAVAGHEEAPAAAEETAAEKDTEPTAAPSGAGQGAAAVVSAALGLVSLTGGWPGTVAAARETLVGQLRTAADASVATQIKEVYGDAWDTTALWGGLFALVALITGVAVLVRPAFGAPGRVAQAPWIKSVAWAASPSG